MYYFFLTVRKKERVMQNRNRTGAIPSYRINDSGNPLGRIILSLAPSVCLLTSTCILPNQQTRTKAKISISKLYYIEFCVQYSITADQKLDGASNKWNHQARCSKIGPHLKIFSTNKALNLANGQWHRMTQLANKVVLNYRSCGWHI